jgi:hypothetical protein
LVDEAQLRVIGTSHKPDPEDPFNKNWAYNKIKCEAK